MMPNPDALWAIVAILVVVALLVRLGVAEQRDRRKEERRMLEKRQNGHDADWQWPS